MNRSHAAGQSHQALVDAKSAEFENISIDLIYGLPGQSPQEWREELSQALEYGVPHYSCYALTVEEKTALDHFVKNGKLKAPSQRNQSEHFDILMDFMREQEVEHYEISNFAKAGFRSRHNSAYWSGKAYLGIGPSAHSFDGQNRYWNIANNAKYINACLASALTPEREKLAGNDVFNEWVMTSLRRIEGCSHIQLKEEFGDYLDGFLMESEVHIKNGLLERKNNAYVLTQQGKHFADRIASDLFAV